MQNTNIPATAYSGYWIQIILPDMDKLSVCLMDGLDGNFFQWFPLLLAWCGEIIYDNLNVYRGWRCRNHNGQYQSRHGEVAHQSVCSDGQLTRQSRIVWTVGVLPCFALIHTALAFRIGQFLSSASSMRLYNIHDSFLPNPLSGTVNLLYIYPGILYTRYFRRWQAALSVYFRFAVVDLRWPFSEESGQIQR